MQLRKHPIMAFWGYARWPPMWIEYQGTNESTLGGEIGVLRRALSHPCNPRQIFLTIGHEGAEYIGCLLMEYEFLGEYMARLLNDCIGMTIESIGSLEVPPPLRDRQKSSNCSLTNELFSSRTSSVSGRCKTNIRQTRNILEVKLEGPSVWKPC